MSDEMQAALDILEAKIDASYSTFTYIRRDQLETIRTALENNIVQHNDMVDGLNQTIESQKQTNDALVKKLRKYQEIDYVKRYRDKVEEMKRIDKTSR